jgi:molecular chaperone GrpE (heat shock protein)
MRDPSVNSGAEIEETVPAPAREGGGSKSGNELDKAGKSILRLLHKAAGATEQKNRHTLETAKNLAQQIRATENRIAELQAEVEVCRQRAERAEQWLHKVYTEIEDRFLR